MTSIAASHSAPVEHIDTGSKHETVDEGLALCLSGGGYRAMLFQLGSLWRLNEMGYLPRLKRISSVSGGSITSAVMGMNWNQLEFDNQGRAGNFANMVADPIRGLADHNLDVKVIFSGILTPGSVNDKLVTSYDKFLFRGKTLQDLPDDPPRFVINATNVQSGALWRFMKPYMRDWRVGEVKNPTTPLAVAVAASSAFPPLLSPAHMELNPSQFTPDSGAGLQTTPYTNEVLLSDGGVYDNLGLETAYKRYRTILVSDAGGKMQPDPDPKHDWIGHSLRVLEMIDNKVRSLRKRQLIEAFTTGERSGTYWGIRTDIAQYGLADAMDCPFSKTIQLANEKTRLKRMDKTLQERLINWGYAVCDAAVRTHLDREVAPPENFPYPQVMV